jgi:GntR family transcriptional regulator
VKLRVDPHSHVPPSAQLVEAVLDAVARGELAEGDRLPSVRAAAELALVNPNTVGKAWRDLETLGVLEGKNGSGVFVCAGGVAIAQELRRKETVDAFRAAVLAALRAGWEIGSLEKALVESARQAGRGRERVKS